VIVLKVGGSVAGAAELGELEDAVVVHGGGPQITAAMADAGLSPTFVRGRRVTDATTLAVVRAALLEVNRKLCEQIGSKAIGLAGDEIGLLATRVPELGHVGTAVPSGPQAILDALAAGRIPVVAPLAVGPLNVNADEAATALAIGLGAERIVFHTDVPGVILPRIAADDADRLLEELEGGIVPKLQAAVRAARLGVRAEIGQTVVVA
jgi:acetylglutamate kinase